MIRTEFKATTLAADDYGHQVFQPDMSSKGSLDISDSDFFHIVGIAVEIVERQAVKTDHRDIVEQLAIAIEA